MSKLSSKKRFLNVQKLLEKYTDEENEMTLKQITEKFSEDYGVNANERTIRDDLKELEGSKKFPVHVNHKGEGFEKYYSYQERLFEIQELRLLIDAVSSAKFITKTETDRIVAKLKKLTSVHQAKQLENRLQLPENVKTNNQQVKYYIYSLHKAISNHQIVRFKYGKYNVDKEFVLGKNGEDYWLKPYALIWNNDYYYLIGQHMEMKTLRHYRVDRIRNIIIEEQKYLPDPDFNITEYTSSLFHMYSGEQERLIQLEFDNHLINVVLDRFGLSANIEPIENNKFILTTNAILSDGLKRWILTWGSDVKVINPFELKEQMKQEVEKLYSKYH